MKATLTSGDTRWSRASWFSRSAQSPPLGRRINHRDRPRATPFCAKFVMRVALWIILAMVVLIAGLRLELEGSARAVGVIPGVVGAYGFSEPGGATTADASGNGNVGTLLGGATRITTGKYGNAISFNGNGAAVRIPDSPSWKVSGSPTYTISLWIKVNNAAGDYRVAIGAGS